MPTIALESLGCKLNQAETEALARQLAAAGYQVVAPGQPFLGKGQPADAYILNTCTVTHLADRKSRHLLRLAHRRHPRALVVATGCYAQRAPHEVAAIEGVGLVVGNTDKGCLLDLIIERLDGNRTPAPGGGQPSLRTRALVKVQDGCPGRCAFCIVPRVRGQGRSRPRSRIIEEARARVAEGYRELVLTGTQLGYYGRGPALSLSKGPGEGGSLQGLVERILAETGVGRLRLSSLQPQDLRPGFIGLWRDKRLCRHLHLPLQSGSGEVLRRMRRPYSLARYQQAVTAVREAVPDAAITTDIIVGFPGESDAEFQESYRFCEGMGFAGIHVFPFSPRPGTEAAAMPGTVGDRVKRERSQRMLALARESARRFREQSLGRVVEVLWEGRLDGVWVGLTDNYLRVFAPSSEPLANYILPARLLRVCQGGLLGQLATTKEE